MDTLEDTLEENVQSRDLSDDEDTLEEHEKPVRSLNEAIDRLSNNVRAFWWGTVDRVHKPTELEFFRKYVAQNKPVIITGAFDDWPALAKWKDKEYLRKAMGTQEVTSDSTPTGHGDCVVDSPTFGQVFVTPFQRKIKFNSFMDILEKKVPFEGVYYLSTQNDVFRKEFQPLWGDVTSSVEDWGTNAFGSKPEAVNLWLGNDRAVSSLHKDFYENLYCVVAGTKHFTLLPPTDIAYLRYLDCTKASYAYDDQTKWSLKVDEPHSTVPWVPGDINRPDLDKFPWMEELSPIHIAINAGEMLYLPSLNFHRVAQSGEYTMAINYWWDMPFGVNFTYFKFVENVASLPRD